MDGPNWIALVPVEFRFTRAQREALEDELTIDLDPVAPALERCVERLLTWRHMAEGFENLHAGVWRDLRRIRAALDDVLAVCGPHTVHTRLVAAALHDAAAGHLPASHLRDWTAAARMLRDAADRALPQRPRGNPGDPARDEFAAYVIVTLEHAGERIKKGRESHIARVLRVLLCAAGERTEYKDTSALVTRALRRIETEQATLESFENSLRRTMPARS